jgi:hypothetical protein
MSIVDFIFCQKIADHFLIDLSQFHSNIEDDTTYFHNLDMNLWLLLVQAYADGFELTSDFLLLFLALLCVKDYHDEVGGLPTAMT